MEKLRVLIVDDEPLAREAVRVLLAADPAIEPVAECASGLAAIAAIQEHAPDLVFLDVQMPAPDGFGVVAAVGAERMPAVIFVTAHDQYALRAFEISALDYLLKPFDEDRFAAALQRARATLRQRRAADLGAQLQTLLAALQPPPQYLERLVVKNGGRIFFLRVDDVTWIEAADNYARVCTAQGDHLIRATLSHLEERLDPQQFLRIRHSAIVNVRCIKELHPQFNGDYTIVLRDGAELNSSRRYRKNLAVLLGE
jgi:two-component system, LytTR family, response regulator